MIKIQKKKLYLISPKIRLRDFKELQKLVKDSGPVPDPKQFDKALWTLLKKKQIYCWLADDLPDDMGIGIKIPDRYKNWEVLEIESIKGRKLK